MHLATMKINDKDGNRFGCIVAFDQKLPLEQQIAVLRGLADMMEKGEETTDHPE